MPSCGGPAVSLSGGAGQLLSLRLLLLLLLGHCSVPVLHAAHAHDSVAQSTPRVRLPARRTLKPNIVILFVDGGWARTAPH